MYLHVKDGLFFKRSLNGWVEIVKRESADEMSNVVFETMLSPNEWASVIASVSIRGDHEPYFQQALDFHGGGVGRQIDNPDL